MTLAVLILAGGMSRRMGQDKALLELEGIPLLRRTWNIAHALSNAVWVVTSRPEAYGVLLPPSVRWIYETPPAPGVTPAGPLVAFTQALAQIEADWVLLLACDLPALQLDVLDQWRQTLPDVSSRTIAYLPRTVKGWEPLCGFYRHSSLPSLQAYIAAGGRSFQQWIDQQTVQSIPDVPAAILLNCNTPEDWTHFCDRASTIALKEQQAPQ